MEFSYYSRLLSNSTNKVVVALFQVAIVNFAFTLGSAFSFAQSNEGIQAATLYAKESSIADAELVVVVYYGCDQPIVPENQYCSVFESIGYPKLDFELKKSFDETLEVSFDLPCSNKGPLCVRKVVYSSHVELGDVPGGYIAVWQNDLKGISVANPSEGGDGVSLSFKIDESLPEPAFEMNLDFTPLALCVNKGIKVDPPIIVTESDSLIFSDELSPIHSVLSNKFEMNTIEAQMVRESDSQNVYPEAVPPYKEYSTNEKVFGKIKLKQVDQGIIIDASKPGDYLWSMRIRRFKDTIEAPPIECYFYTSAYQN